MGGPEIAASTTVLTQTRTAPPWAAQRIRRCFVHLPWALIAFAYAAVAFSFLHPASFWDTAPPLVAAGWTAAMVRTFLFHAGLALLVFAAAATLLRRWHLALALAPLVLFTLAPTAWSYLPKQPPAVAGDTLQVMSLNLLYANRNVNAVLGEIAAIRPDVLLLQEFSARWRDALVPALAAEFPYSHCVVGRGVRGQAVFSRQAFESPPENVPAVGAEGNPQLRTVVRIGDRRVALYNVHLRTPSKPPKCIEQRLQFARLLGVLEQEPLPAIVAGDFNAASGTPYTDALREAGLIDVHDLSGHGRGATWPAYRWWAYVPGIRIDHIFVSAELTSPTSHVGQRVGSDHRPVIAEIGLRAPEGRGR